MNPAVVVGVVSALVFIAIAFFIGREFGKIEVKEYAKLASAQLRHAEEVRRIAQGMMKDAGIGQ